MSEETFDEWAVLELMGHRKLAGRVTEATIGGSPFVRIEVPQSSGKMATQFYSPSAVYCITPTTEQMVVRVAARNMVAPISRWEIEQPLPYEGHAEHPYGYEGPCGCTMCLEYGADSEEDT